LVGSIYSVKVTTKNALRGLAKPQRVAAMLSNEIATAWPISAGQYPTNDRAADERQQQSHCCARSLRRARSHFSGDDKLP
jgi:hypothetical protein